MKIQFSIDGYRNFAAVNKAAKRIRAMGKANNWSPEHVNRLIDEMLAEHGYTHQEPTDERNR